MEKYFKCSKPPIRFVGFAMNELRSSSITRWKIHILEYLTSPSAEKHTSTYSCGIIHQHYASIPSNNTGAWGMEYYLVGGFNLPLWKIMEFVNEKDDIPYMKWKIKVMFQSPPTSHHCSSFFLGKSTFLGPSHPKPVIWMGWMIATGSFPKIRTRFIWMHPMSPQGRWYPSAREWLLYLSRWIRWFMAYIYICGTYIYIYTYIYYSYLFMGFENQQRNLVATTLYQQFHY